VKVGDYVLVDKFVHDDQMPQARSGVIVEMYFTPKRKLRDSALVMFENGTFLKFHVSQLEVLKTANESR